MEPDVRTYAYTLVTNGRGQAQERAALVRRNVDRLFQDWTTDPKASRPQFDRLKVFLQPGDTLVVWKIDRLGLDDADRLAFFEWLQAQQIALVCLTEAGTLADFIAEIRLTLWQADPMNGENKATLRHLCELETQAAKLAKALQGADAATAQDAEAVKAMAGDLRQHLKFISQQIRFGDYAAALGRINDIASDF